MSELTPRQKLLSNWLYTKSKKRLPKMSKTEQEALDAGDSWWEAEVFRGKPDWEQLQRLSLTELSIEEQAFLDHEVTELCQMLDEWNIVHEAKDLPQPVWQFIRDKGFFGLVISKNFGGKGFSAAAHSAVVMKVATRSLAAAVTVMVPNSLGPGELLQHYGTEEQKQQFLPALAAGIEVPCFALTGPEAGSDAAAMPDKGIVCKGMHEGQEVLGIKLNFNKRYITLAPVATLIGLAFKLYDPEHLLGQDADLGITVCLLPRQHPGIEIGERHLPLDQVFMNGPIRGKDVFVPLDWIIGGAKMVGQGWRMLVECLSIGRAISLPAVSTAYAALCFCMSGAYASVREQFKTPIGRFEGIEQALAEIGGFTYMMEATRLLTLTAVDKKIKPATASAIAKYHLTELGRKILNHAMDIHGGRGIMLGPRNYLGRAYQGMPICITVEGANILTRNLIIFGQGAMSCHPFLHQEYTAMQMPDGREAVKVFDKAVFGHLAYLGKNLLRHTWLRVSRGHLNKPVMGKLRVYYRQLSCLSAAYAVLADLSLLILGGELKRKERLSARLGDVMSHLYMASAVGKYYKAHGEDATEALFAEWAMQYCLYQAGEALTDTLRNFPNPIVRGILKLFIQLGGNTYRRPSDKLDHKLSQAMLKDSDLRQRLASQCFIPNNPQDSVGRMEAAFQAMLAAQEAQIKLKMAVRSRAINPYLSRTEQIEQSFNRGELTQAECNSLLEAEALRQEAIQVDAFTQQYIAGK
jgi:acyl-CoA dehydrogenase